MTSSGIIPLGDLVRLMGTPNCPAIIDVRPDAETRKLLIPTSLRRDPHEVVYWAAEFVGQSVIVICETGAGRGLTFSESRLLQINFSD